MLEAQPLQRVGELDVNAKVVGVQLELVSRSQSAVLVGTMTGTAELVAQELDLAFGDENLAIEITLMDGLDHRVFGRPGIFLICTSTYGQGEVPDNAKALYADLLSSRPDLSRVRYGVFALGDSTHVGTFCFGGKRFDEALSGLGAT